MNPKRIIVMRHGESQEDVDKSVYAHTADLDIGLSPRGQEQSIEIGNKLAEILRSGRVHFYLSPGLRLKQTYDIISAGFSPNINSTHTVEDLILKQNWGDVTVDNRREIEIARYKEGVLVYKFPNGESGAELLERFRTFIYNLRKEFERDDFPDNVVILTHGFEMRIFLITWFDWSHAFFETLANPRNCELKTIVLQEDGSYQLQEEMRRYDISTNPNHISRV